MSNDTSWDIQKYREEHESDGHWELRKAFMQRWKDDYPEERLVCLAQVFANIEFMGCRYPLETMQEIARLSKEVANNYRKHKKTKLQRTFVSASDAAEDRAKGIRREGGIIKDTPPSKSKKIEFVPQGHSHHIEKESDIIDPKNVEISTTEGDSLKENQNSSDVDEMEHNELLTNTKDITEKTDEVVNKSNYKEALMAMYRNEMLNFNCTDVRNFREHMFSTPYGRFVLMIRPWTSKLVNIQASVQASKLTFNTTYKNSTYSMTMNGVVLAEAYAETKIEARSIAETLAWNRLINSSIIIMVKEQFRAHGDKQLSMDDVSRRKEEFGTPVDNSVAVKMMKLMGWKGGGLGADAQGIEEPIKPNLQLVKRAGLGSTIPDIRQLKRSAMDLMKRFNSSDALDVDLIFTSEFSKEERAALHECAKRAGLASRSYGDTDRFLVVRKKIDPFSIVRAVVEKGGETPKYQVYIPAALANNR